MSVRRAQSRRVLLATSSLAALVLGWGGAAEAACVVNPATPYNNTGAINCVTFNDNVTHSGDVTNATGGTITILGFPGQFGEASGMSVFGAGTQINGNVVNNGTISSGTANQPQAETGIGVDAGAFPGSVVNGSITNNGTINVTALGIDIGGNVTGSITNNNIIKSGWTAIQVTGTNSGGVTTIGGSIINAGTITFTTAATPQFPSASNPAVGIGVFKAQVGGSVSNTGSITTAGQTGIEVSGSTVVGAVSNSGTITATGTSAAQFNFPVGIAVFDSNVGSIQNTGNGVITADQFGILMLSLGATNDTTADSITNSASVTSNGGAGFAGIALSNSSVTGDITNATGGVIHAANAAGILITNTTPNATVAAGASSVGGNVVNQGTITASTGIMVTGGSTVGGISNSGTLTGTTAAIDVTGEGAATTITQSGGTITGNILLSALGDTVDITGGTLAGNIVGQASTGTVNFALGSGSFTYGNTISAVNAVNVNSGTVIFTGTNTYTGNTNINGGVLEVNGSIATSSLTNVNSSGMLAGTGTVGNVQVNSGGTFTPGAFGSPGTAMTVSGNLAFQSGALYMVQLNPATSTIANVSGTGTLAGTVEAVFANGTYAVKQYDILHTAGLGGTSFGGVADFNLPAGFATSLSYSATDVFLNLTAQLGAQSGLNQNQQNVANAINAFFNNGGALPPNFMTIFGLTGTPLAMALSKLDGEVATDAQKGAFQLMSDFLNLMLDPSSGGGVGGGSGGGALGFAPQQDATLPPEIALAYNSMLTKAPPKEAGFDQRWSAWGGAFGGTSRTNGDPVIGSTNVTAGDSGFAGGMDYRLTADTKLGFALAGGGTNWSLAQGLGSGRSDAFQGGVYAKTHSGPAYLSAALAFADHWFTTDRTAPLGDQLQAKFQGQSYGGRIEAGYRYGLPAANYLVGFTPYGAVQAQSFHTPSYSETDLTGGGFGLTYNAMNATDTRSELGARLDDLTMLGAMPLILRGRLAWAHDWVGNPALGAAFQALPGSAFIVNGAAPPKNSALTTAGAELRMTANWSLLAKFDGDFGSGSQTYAGSGTLRYMW
jgi:uncharacterized protein with beta-barrel porin domain